MSLRQINLPANSSQGSVVIGERDPAARHVPEHIFVVPRKKEINTRPAVSGDALGIAPVHCCCHQNGPQSRCIFSILC